MAEKNILFLEPFYGGSHREFADGLIRHSRHRFTLKTLPARFWKWRMRGAALHFVHTIESIDQYDLLFISDLMSLADLKALSPVPLPPTVVYFHESQLSYPLPEGERMDYQFGFTDITTGLAADILIFNSRFHHDAFFRELPRFIRRMPEHKPTWATSLLGKKSRVLHPGCDLAPLLPSRTTRGDDVPLILWNHRWEFDKDPDCFFRLLNGLDDEGYQFDLALLGENFQAVPKPFIAARERYGPRIKTYGYCRDRNEYYRWLNMSDIVVSCAIQENFGLAVVEAVAAGAWPLLPNRLAYPEVLPEEAHEDHLYGSEEELYRKLASLLSDGIPPVTNLAAKMRHYDWRRMIGQYDELFDRLADGGI